MKISNLSIMMMVISLFLSIAIPVILFLFFKNKTKTPYKSFFTGVLVFIVFAILLEKSILSFLLTSPLGSNIKENVILYCLVGGLFAGVFEELGRFTAYKTILKKSFDNNNNALMYGAGHGGIEVIMISSFAMISNISLSVMFNSGNLQSVIGEASAESVAQLQGMINQLQEANPFMFLLTILERIPAVIMHISFSVLVWFSVKNHKVYLLLSSIILHSFVDFIAGYVSVSGVSLILVEVILLCLSLVVLALALYIWKKNNKKEEIVGLSGNI